MALNRGSWCNDAPRLFPTGDRGTPYQRIVYPANGDGYPITIAGRAALVIKRTGPANVLLKGRPPAPSLHNPAETSGLPRHHPQSFNEKLSVGSNITREPTSDPH
jgi:hypothetical protein